MNLIPVKHIFSILILAAGAVIGGAAMTAQLTSDDLGLAFLFLGAGCLVLCLAGLIGLRIWARGRALAFLLFWSLGINAAFTSITFAIALPLFLMHGIFSRTGVLLLVYFAVMLAYQLRRAGRHFNLRWEKYHERALDFCYRADSGEIYIQGLMNNLHVRTDLFFPAWLQFLKTPIWIALIPSMLIGLSFRSTHPEFSALAAGIPALTLAVMLLQLSCNPVLAALKLGAIERSTGRRMVPMTEDDPFVVNAQNRKASSSDENEPEDGQ